ncbi:response regulator [Chitinophagaceae bacterium MMS25-I14]
MTRIAIIEDHRMIAETMQHALSKYFPGCDIRLFEQGEAFLQRGEKWIPELILMDMMMPGLNGLELVDEIKKDLQQNDTKIIIVSSVNDTYLVKQAIRKGINGYVSKEAQLEELFDAVTAVQKGEEYISRLLSQKLIRNIFTEEKVTYYLSPREKEVLQLVCSGNTMKEVAFSLKLTQNTVQSYYKNIMKKFNVNKTTDLIVAAIEAGLFIPKKKS